MTDLLETRTGHWELQEIIRKAVAMYKWDPEMHWEEERERSVFKHGLQESERTTYDERRQREKERRQREKERRQREKEEIENIVSLTGKENITELINF